MTTHAHHTPLALDWFKVVLAGLAAANTRLAMLTVGPLLPLIATDLNLNATAAGLLTGLPLLIIGVLSIPAGVASDRVGPWRMLFATQAVVVLAGGARGLATEPVLLFVATAALGAAVGLGQPAFAQVAREARGVGAAVATAVYSNGFVLGALAAFWFSVPLLDVVDGTWEGVVRLWALLGAMVPLGALLFVFRAPVTPRGTRLQWALGDVVRIPGLLISALVYTGQNVVFYALASWLTAIYVAQGWPLETASLPLPVMETASAVGSLASPFLSLWLGGTRRTLFLASCLSTVGLLGLLLAPTGPAFVWAVLIGLGLASVMVLTLAAPAALAPAQRVGAVSGAFLTVGFVGPVLGPFTVGLLRDLSGGFAAGVAFLTLVSAVMALGSLFTPALERQTVGSPPR